MWIAGGVTDMRRGMNTLAVAVQQGLGRDPPSVVSRLGIKRRMKAGRKQLSKKMNSGSVAELTEAVEAVREMFEAVETEEAEIVNVKLHMPQWPDIVSRMHGADPDGVSSPIRCLIGSFVGLILRLSRRMPDSDAPQVQVQVQVQDEMPRFWG